MPTRRVVVDHLVLPVADLERSIAFYEAALAPLGFRLVARRERAAGFGAEQLDDFYVRAGGGVTGVHVAFAADARAAVDAFHEAALAAGGCDNGPPGIRPQYSERYYAAFVLDPDGNNVEAVWHMPADDPT